MKSTVWRDYNFVTVKKKSRKSSEISRVLDWLGFIVGSEIGLRTVLTELNNANLIGDQYNKLIIIYRFLFGAYFII